MKCPSCGKSVSKHKTTCSSCEAELPVSAAQELSATSESDGKLYPILGWVFVVLTLIVLPIIFGPAAFVMGVLTFRKRSKVHGIVLMVVSVIVLIIAVILSALLMVA